MLSLLRKLLGSKTAEVAVPYKVETPVAKEPAKKPAAKKVAAKAKTTRKPRTPKA
jgi:hypothetical protein